LEKGAAAVVPASPFLMCPDTTALRFGRLENALRIAREPDVASDEPIMASVAGRYASALFELASEERAVADVEKKLAEFQALLDGSPDLERLIRSPVFSAEDQLKALSAILDRAQIGGLAGNFLRLIAKNRRLFAAPGMIKAFRALTARARGEVEAEVTSAFQLKDAQVEALKEALRASAGKDVRLNLKVDPALIGGLIVKLGSRMIDSSLRTKLSSLKVRMKEVR
jgi:F-type H+-transporting ATPase subunit delta